MELVSPSGERRRLCSLYRRVREGSEQSESMPVAGECDIKTCDPALVVNERTWIGSGRGSRVTPIEIRITESLPQDSARLILARTPPKLEIPGDYLGT